MYIIRDIEKKLAPFIKRREAIAIIGPRQAGKTTLLENLQQSIERTGRRVVFLTFEKRADLQLFQSSVDDFRALHKNYDIIIIDEFQYAKDGGQKLKYLYDTTKTKYIISGSSSLDLTFQTGKCMVGRMFTFTLLPLSFREYLSSADPRLAKLLEDRAPDPLRKSLASPSILGVPLMQAMQKHFETYLRFGGYPAVALAKTHGEKEKILESILDNYLLKDIKSLLQLATDEELIRLVQFLATQIGGLVQYKELSSTAGLSYPALRKHLDILRNTYLIELLRPYYANRRTELTKNPKVYFFDTGFRNHLLADFRTLSMRRDMGQLVENAIFTALYRHESTGQRIHFWRTKSGAEVDFVVEHAGTLLPIEVKYSRTPTIGKSLYNFIEKFSPKRAIICTQETQKVEHIGACRVEFIPASYIA